MGHDVLLLISKRARLGVNDNDGEMRAKGVMERWREVRTERWSEGGNGKTEVKARNCLCGQRIEGGKLGFTASNSCFQMRRGKEESASSMPIEH